MLTTLELKSLYLMMKKYLDVLLENRFFYGNAEYREHIAEVIKNEAGLFKFLSSKIGEENVYKNTIKKFKELFLEDNFSLVNEQDYEDRDFNSLKDEINYLKVCVKNICKVDLDNLDEELLVHEENNTQYKDKPDAEAVFNNVFNEGVSISSDSQTLDQEFGNLLLRSHAYERLNQDINDGTIYIYKTKPRINVFLKYLLSVLLVLGACFSLASLVSCVVRQTGLVATIPDFLLLMVSLVYFVISLGYLWKTLKNDNFKYSWQKRNFFFVFISMMIGLWTYIGTFDFLKNYNFLAIILVLILVITSSIYSLAYFFLQPERDNKLINSILEKHISDISSQGVSFK